MHKTIQHTTSVSFFHKLKLFIHPTWQKNAYIPRILLFWGENQTIQNFPQLCLPRARNLAFVFFFGHISHHQGYRHFCCFFSPVPRLLASPWQWFLTFVFFPDHQGIFFFFILFFLMLFWRAVTGITIEDDDYEDFMSIITLQKGVFISVFFFNLICF